MEGWSVLGAQRMADLDEVTRLALQDSRAPVHFAAVDDQEALAGHLRETTASPSASVAAVLVDLDRYVYASPPPTVTWHEGGSTWAAATVGAGLGQFFTPDVSDARDAVSAWNLARSARAAWRRLCASLREHSQPPIVLTSLGAIQAATPPAGAIQPSRDDIDLTLITGWSRTDAAAALRHAPLPVKSVVTEGSAYESAVGPLGWLELPRQLFTDAELQAAKQAWYALLEETALASNSADTSAFVFRSQPNEAGIGVYVNLDGEEAERMEATLASPRRKLATHAALASALRSAGLACTVLGSSVSVDDHAEAAYWIEKKMAQLHSFWPYALWRQDGRLHVSLQPAPPPDGPNTREGRMALLQEACHRIEESGAARSEHVVVQKDSCIDIFVRTKQAYAEQVASRVGPKGTRRVVYVSRGTASDAPLIANLALAHRARFEAYSIRDLPPALQGLRIHTARRDDDVQSMLTDLGARFAWLRRGLASWPPTAERRRQRP
ncbi:MAG TPA: hypothetical protein VHI93_09135 [Candidatus Thermoplasmatota archaeon]|nr:hypothetical protein [Candidatus Thermoplasmatota archaeon]